MAEAMGGNLGHPGRLTERRDPAQQPGIIDRSAIGTEPQGSVGRAGRVSQIAGQGQGGGVGEVNGPVFAALALADQQPPSGQVQIADLQINTLTGPQPGVGQDEEAGVFQADQRVRTIQAGCDEGFQASASAVRQATG
jgi:hypothetical protein